MKKLVALLLVLCMAVSLVACGNPDSGKDGTTGSTNATTGNNNGGNSGNNGGSSASKNNDDLINPEKFGGKTLQLYGFSSAAFEDIEEMGYGSYIWMMRAAIDEWAYLNNVTIVFEGDYEQNALLGAINSGAKPDMFLHCDKFPAVANLGITRELTEDEYNQLASICGNSYLDMMNYKGKSHGVNYPWSGMSLFYYNKTMFEEYGEKTPKEYYMEGNWTWETMEKCLEAITKDLDSDGKKDTYGSGWIWNLANQLQTKIDVDGKMLLMLDDPKCEEMYRKWLDMEYKGYNVTGALGAYGDCDVATTPRPGTHIGDAELYNYAHLNQTLVNGDVIETIPTPLYDYNTSRLTGVTPAFMSILSTCDESEATLALMSYILRVGMAYMDEFSVGLFECDYEGMRGATEYSQGWKDNFADIVAERQEEFDALEDWDAELYEKMSAEISASTKFTGGSTAVPADNSIQNDVKDLPSASAYPIIYNKYKAIVDKYNSLYAN